MCGGERKKLLSQIPLGLGYLISNCGHDLEVVTDKKQLVDCDLIGLSALSSGIREAVGILENTDIPIVIGGQATLWDGLKRYPFYKIVKGEGEFAFSDILNGEAGSEQVLAYENIKDIDSLKFPERGNCGRGVPIITSRGCPFSCKFCSSQEYWGKARFHSAEYFIDEVDYLLGRYPGMTQLRIMDDLFFAHKPRLEKIYKAWMGKGLDRRLSVRGFVRASIFDEDVAVKMRTMKFTSVRFGAESGSDRVLDILGKGCTVEDNQRVVDISRKVGLRVSASFMHDIPGETEDDKRLTLDFIAKNRIRVSGWYKFVAFPGTEMYDGRDPMAEDMRVRF